VKKTTKHGRKLQRTGGAFNGAAWANTITMCRPYGDEVPLVIPGLIEGTQDTGSTSLQSVQRAYARLLTGAGQADDFDLLASSPAQMQEVDRLHSRWLQGRELTPA
jgi:hypothetical protein